jgi:PAS domain-containing protein
MARQRALLEAIIESVDEGIVAVDTSRRTVAINAVARGMVGEGFSRKVLSEDWRSTITAVYENGSHMPPQDGPLARAMRGEAPDGVIYQIIPAGQDRRPPENIRKGRTHVVQPALPIWRYSSRRGIVPKRTHEKTGRESAR